MPPIAASNSLVRAVKELYKSDEVVKAILDHCHGRSKNFRTSSADTLLNLVRRSGLRVGRSKVIAALKELEDAGCGMFVVGRRQNPSRLEWHVQTVSLAQAVRGERTLVEELGPDEGVDEEDDDELSLNDIATDLSMLTHVFHLRPGMSVGLTLPDDLTVKEAARLADFIRTLPFSSDEEQAA